MTTKPLKKHLIKILPVMALAFSFPCLAQTTTQPPTDTSQTDPHAGLIKRPEPQYTPQSKKPDNPGPTGPQSQNENSEGQTQQPNNPSSSSPQNPENAPGQTTDENPYAVNPPSAPVKPQNKTDGENNPQGATDYTLKLPDSYGAVRPDPENPLKTTIIRWKTPQQKDRLIVLSFPREGLAISGHVYINGKDTTKPQIDALPGAEAGDERLTTEDSPN